MYYLRLQLYNFIRDSEPIVKLYFSYKAHDDFCPPMYYHVRTFEEIGLVSGPALVYNKKIIVATKSIATFPNSDHLYIVRL